MRSGYESRDDGHRFGRVARRPAASAISACTASMSSARTCSIRFVERRRGQRTGLGEHEHLLAEDHQRRDRHDVERGAELGLRLGVDLAEHDVGVVGRRPARTPARTAGTGRTTRPRSRASTMSLSVTVASKLSVVISTVAMRSPLRRRCRTRYNGRRDPAHSRLTSHSPGRIGPQDRRARAGRGARSTSPSAASPAAGSRSRSGSRGARRATTTQPRKPGELDRPDLARPRPGARSSPSCPCRGSGTCGAGRRRTIWRAT